MNIAILPSARDRDAEANLRAFVEKGKVSDAFGDVIFESPVWEGTVLKKHRRITAGVTSAANFYFTETSAERGATALEPLCEPFASFIKALLRLREDARPQMAENHRVMLRAAKHLYFALAESDHNPCLLLPRHFDEAARRAASVETQRTAYTTGNQLAELATWVNEHGIARIRVNWKNTISCPSKDDRVGDDARQRRDGKMPSPAALEALPQIANLLNETSNPADVLRMRTVELLVCGGWRINELLSIPADCEVEEGREGEPGHRYGIRYIAEKGFGATIKWIPTPMVSVAKRAVADIRRLTQPVRDDAIFIYENPGQHPLPALRRSRSELIGVKALEKSLGFMERGARNFCRTRNIEVENRGQNASVRVGDVIDALIQAMPVVPTSFPLKLHEFMFLVRENAMHGNRGVINGSVRLLLWSMMNNFLAGKPGVRSIFDRHGFSEPDGSPITVNTHSFRHWLNTLAQEGGMSQELIARWSGRKDVNQNSVYDHVSGAELARKVRGMIDEGGLIGQIARVRDALPPAEREDFLATQLATGHVTEIGICVHDWQLAPCPVHGDCSTCGEHVIDKNNQSQRSEAERQLIEVSAMLSIAEAEVDDGTLGAPRWVEAHRRRRDGLLEVLAVHDNGEIPDGTFVHLGDRTDMSSR